MDKNKKKIRIDDDIFLNISNYNNTQVTNEIINDINNFIRKLRKHQYIKIKNIDVDVDINLIELDNKTIREKIKNKDFKDISYWDVSNVTDMSDLFKSNSGINLFNYNISNWNVSNVTDMSNMFYGCIDFNQYIGSWNVSKVTNMSNMFYDCHSFKGSNLHYWDVSNVSNMKNMFYECYNFNDDIKYWDVYNVTKMNAHREKK